MPNIQKFWARVNKLVEILPAEVFIISISNVEKEESIGWQVGTVCGAPAKLAATRICEGTHRLATPEEVAKYHQERSDGSAMCQAIENKNAKNSSVTMGTAMIEALRQLGIGGSN